MHSVIIVLVLEHGTGPAAPNSIGFGTTIHLHNIEPRKWIQVIGSFK